MTAVAEQTNRGVRGPVEDEFDPRTRGIGLVGKLAVFIVISVVAAAATEPILLGAVFVGLLLLTLSTGLKPKTVLGAIKPIAPVVVILFVFSSLFYKPATARQDFAHTVFANLVQTDFITLTISAGGLLFGLGIVIKLLLVMIVSIYLISTTPTEQLLAGLQAIKVPNAIGLMMSMAVRFIPTMSSEVATIKDAQRARGAGSSRQAGQRRQPVQGTLPLFVPMIVTSMRRADTMAMSMVSRGYGFTKERTIMARLHVGFWDYLAVGLGVVATVLFFLGRASLGFGIL